MYKTQKEMEQELIKIRKEIKENAKKKSTQKWRVGGDCS